MLRGSAVLNPARSHFLQVLNPGEKVSPYEGLKSITINVARQHREEATKGTLTVGKLADLVILSGNPLKV